MRKVAVFDFDGTLTSKDTLLEFIKYTHGMQSLLMGFALHMPILILMKLHLYPNWKAKQKIFTWFYKDMPYKTFESLGVEFANHIESIRKESTIQQMFDLRNQGAEIYVISASVEEWVRPFCNRLGIRNVIGTKVECINGKLTGKFITKNCYGQEKVNRLLEFEQNRSEYYLYAFGDSRGDKEMFSYANESSLIK